MEAKPASLSHEDHAETQVVIDPVVDSAVSLISDSHDVKTGNQESQITEMEVDGSGGNVTPAPPEQQVVSTGIKISRGRISDSAGKKLCHQCRRYKTLLVTCKNPTKNNPCRIRICHECLWNRYAETAEEINALLQWSCPKCQGTCNCSICMKRRGLKPTGSLHKKAKGTRRAGTSKAANTSAPLNKEVPLLKWTEEWEKENANVSGGESIKESRKD